MMWLYGGPLLEQGRHGLLNVYLGLFRAGQSGPGSVDWPHINLCYVGA